MANQIGHRSYRSKLRDSLSGAVGGVIGTLLLNITIPETGFPYIVYMFMLPGLILGAILGYFLSPLIGRNGAAIISAVVGFIAVLLGILLFLK